MTPETSLPGAPAPSQRLRGDAILLMITAVWGITFVTVKDALEGADPMTFLALRFGLGALVAGVAARKALLVSVPWRAGLTLGTLLFIGYVFQTVGLAYTTPSRSAFITGLCVILVPFVSTVMFRRWPPVLAVTGAVIALIGTAVLTDAQLSGPLPLGDVLTLGCAVAYAFHISLTEKFSAQSEPISLVAFQLAVVAVLSTCTLPFVERKLIPSTSLFAAVAVTGIIASALAISLQTWAQAKTTAVRASVIFALEPVFAIAWGATLGRAPLTGHEMFGGGLIILGVIVASAAPASLTTATQSPAASSD